MMIKNAGNQRNQIQFVSADSLVPEDHLLRDIDRAIDFSFIYELVQDKYSQDQGRPSLDPVMLIKIPLLQYLYGIPSMRQTIREIEVNVAYRWFLGLDLTSSVPHFSTFGKNYTRRFKGTNLFEQIFEKILEECFLHGMIDPSVIFVDATHIKANANKKKSIKKLVKVQAMGYESKLLQEINEDRQAHGKKPFADKEDDDEDPPTKEVQQSTSDPESGLFHKGEHKKDFAYVTQTACDQNGWVLGYTIHPGNEHDSRTFPAIYERLKKYDPTLMVLDAGYKTPAIAKTLLDDGIKPVYPYRRSMTKKGFFKKHEYVYDEYFDCYLCPNNQVLRYATTNREGYREYKSDPSICVNCPYLSQCTESKSHQKTVTRHIWEPYLEICEEIRHTLGMKEWYEKRKESIERIFGTAKEFHGMRYTRYNGKALMEMKVGLTFACMNLKKLAKVKRRKGLLDPVDTSFLLNPFRNLIRSLKKKRVSEVFVF
ncbi:MAG: IS1182 family transposase [Anaerovoracaceae bacterium]|jgi:transposase